MMKNIFLILLIVFSGKATAQRQWYFAARHTMNTPILNQVQVTAAAAFSLRKINSVYTGSAIRVRRSTDNVEQDIGFNASGDLNTADLVSFIGGASGFITTWYDQSGNFFNITQATAANQPRIVNAGTIDLLGSRPSIRGDATDLLLGGDAFGGSANEVEIFIVTNIYDISNGTPGATMFGLADSPRFIANLPWSDTNIYFDVAGSSAPNRLTITGDQVPINTNHQFTFSHSLSQNIQRVRKNGTSIGNDGSGHSIASSFLRVSNASPNGVQGYYPEIIFFKGILTDNQRALVERNQGTYYGITVN